MPTLAAAEASNAAFAPNYLPVAVFVGGTSGVGQAMAEAFARQMKGRAHIIIIGRNTTAAAEILAAFPKPAESDGWAHEFVPCDASSMADVRAACEGLNARLAYINFLVITAGGPAANSLVASSVTPEGLDDHLAMRYFMRYIFTKELLPLLVRARENGQHAHMMTVLGAGFGISIPTTDLGLHEARRRSIKILQGGITRGVTYNDGLVAHFASLHPEIAFTHISPGQVRTIGGKIHLGWLFTPLTWLVNLLKTSIAVTQDECAQYMLYGLLDGERGLFIRGQRGDAISAHVFNPDHKAHFEVTAHKTVRFQFSSRVRQ
ncbi:hypothetical protein DFH07DRAFT_758015 [Mycena maculata]|uniref:NAD(P)-binding protein n=1 Tax=Mycena maculata TaxID=230809 RepID=A0AAD7HRM2_9AGAR|nr:hypothetical protein DFH07DRAFT_758015 [Mycena maculata]